MKKNEPERQKGFALVVAMLILLVMTLIGIGGINATIFETDIARNDRLKANAFLRLRGREPGGARPDPLSDAHSCDSIRGWGSLLERGGLLTRPHRSL